MYVCPGYYKVNWFEPRSICPQFTSNATPPQLCLRSPPTYINPTTLSGTRPNKPLSNFDEWFIHHNAHELKKQPNSTQDFIKLSVNQQRSSLPTQIWGSSPARSHQRYAFSQWTSRKSPLCQRNNQVSSGQFDHAVPGSLVTRSTSMLHSQLTESSRMQLCQRKDSRYRGA